MRKLIEHNLPVYYNSEYNGLFVVHSYNGKTAIVGSCCKFYNDAYTSIGRYEIPVEMLGEWLRLDKDKIESYPFLMVDDMVDALCVADLPLNGISYDIKRAEWYENPKIIRMWYEAIYNYESWD